MKHIDAHIEKFGVEPIVIGLHWDDPELTERLIYKSIESGKPYNEEEELSKDELKAFNDGSLAL